MTTAMLVSINPFTGEKIAEHAALQGEQITAQIGLAAAAFPAWAAKSHAERGKVMHAVAAQLRKQKSWLAELMALEMGKPVKEGGPEVEKAATCCEYYAEHANRHLADEWLASDASESYVKYQPLGTLLGILPWNAPAWLAFRYLAPALMAGNTCVMKHDPNVPATAQALADIFKEASAPAGIVVNLPARTEHVEQAIRDPRIMAVSFTGSSAAGRKVAAIAASELKPAVLELGGSDPCIVLADADLERAADIVVLSRTINAGQSCIAAKRILIEAKVYEEFTTLLRVRLSKLKMGSPLDATTDIGPIARKDLRENLHRQVQQTIAEGASCLLGGELPSAPGFHYPPTLLADVKPGMCAFEEETFGPVMAVMSIENIDEALAVANNTNYGLGSSIWTASTSKAMRAVNELQAGQVAVNGIVKTDPRLPSGGIKQSGYGRELGPHGIREFVNAKQVWIK
ncbi:NAD-dependent succinate-semialdehyde dehydrogenase [Limnobacter sp.]|uniref:NAD-dependent succinate-semialdehyde dehydrogenase n=1 Tax=Limnobacter sp. TaxID=2003368 RepID=UPI002733F026|nr:NAD-dependent succinate-semialdehyde dehydrogenase [Limnobacter sp.]MDP3187862.1 NAD-dependent succinate-semialdehyde dehydrogenase [Limnobacter sp.]